MGLFGLDLRKLFGPANNNLRRRILISRQASFSGQQPNKPINIYFESASAQTPAHYNLFSRSTRGSTPPEQQEGKGMRCLRFGRTQPQRRMDALPTLGETMQQKVGRRDTTPDLFFETSKYNSCNIRLKAVETL